MKSALAAVAALLALGAFASGCGGVAHGSGLPAPTIPAPQIHRAAHIVQPWVTTSHGRFVDAAGHRVVLRGVDVAIAPPAVYRAALGMHVNFVRIVAPWSSFERVQPKGGVHHWDTHELTRLDHEVRFFGRHGVNVLIDFHQFRWSSYFTRNFPCTTGLCQPRGVPDWYYANARFTVTKGGQKDAQAAFWTTESKNSEHAYGAFAAMMAAHFAGDPNVVGYEVINEPHGGSLAPQAHATQVMLRWQGAIARVLHTVDPTRTVFVMCDGGGNGVGTADLRAVGSLQHVALDWHDYFNGANGAGLDSSGDSWVPSWAMTHNQQASGYSGTAANQARVLSWPLRTAQRFGVPLLIGEWGIRYSAPGWQTYQSQMLGLFSQYGISNARWELKVGGGLSLLNADGTLNGAGRQLATASG